MANKLKNMRLTSVDLVRNGANQEADICLFKSTDPEETPVLPTTEEKNIFKRFINWMRENHADETQDDEETVEKDYTTFRSLNATRESNEKLWQYTSALTESIRSIQMDKELSKDEKHQLMAQSLDQFDEAMDKLIEVLCEANPPGDLAKSNQEEEEVEKFNPNHDSLGRFASGGGGGAVSAGTKSLKDIVMGNGPQSERAEALADMLSAGGSGWTVTRGNTVELAEDTGGKYMSEVRVNPKRGGYFDTEFVYSDGVSGRETYDSVEALRNAAGKFLRTERILNSAVGKSADFDEIEEV